MRANCFKNSVMPLVLFTCVVFSYTGNHADGQGPVADPEFYPLPCTATVTAEVVALDQTLWYNRFGAFDPNGMIYALASDVVSRDGGPIAPGNARVPLLLDDPVTLGDRFNRWLPSVMES